MNTALACYGLLQQQFSRLSSVKIWWSFLSNRTLLGMSHFSFSYFFSFVHTPFQNAQRWMGKNTFPILLLNDDNMIGEHQETRIEMPNMCPFEKKEKEGFFRLSTFFFRNKKILSKEQLLFSFLCIVKQKKISERSEKF